MTDTTEKQASTVEITAEQARELGLDVKPSETVKVKVKPERPVWSNCRAVMDVGGRVWVRRLDVWHNPYYSDEQTSETLEKNFGPIRPLVDPDGEVLLPDDMIEAALRELARSGIPRADLGIVGVVLRQLFGIPEHGAGDSR